MLITPSNMIKLLSRNVSIQFIQFNWMHTALPKSSRQCHCKMFWEIQCGWGLHPHRTQGHALWQDTSYYPLPSPVGYQQCTISLFSPAWERYYSLCNIFVSKTNKQANTKTFILEMRGKWHRERREEALLATRIVGSCKTLQHQISFS